MKTLVAYASKHGCTEKCAKLIAEKVPGEVKLINLMQEKKVDISAFDTVIIGGSVHVGKVQKEVTDFCTAYMQELLQRELGLFLCCANPEQIELQINTAFPEQLCNHAKAIVHAGYAYYFDKMNFLEKTIIRKIAKVNQTEESISRENMERLISAVLGAEVK